MRKASNSLPPVNVRPMPPVSPPKKSEEKSNWHPKTEHLEKQVGTLNELVMALMTKMVELQDELEQLKQDHAMGRTRYDPVRSTMPRKHPMVPDQYVDHVGRSDKLSGTVVGIDPDHSPFPKSTTTWTRIENPTDMTYTIIGRDAAGNTTLSVKHNRNGSIDYTK